MAKGLLGTRPETVARMVAAIKRAGGQEGPGPEVVVTTTENDLARQVEDALVEERKARPQDPRWKSMGETNRRRQEILDRIQRQRDVIDRDRRQAERIATLSEKARRATQEQEDNAFTFGVDRAKGPDQTVAVLTSTWGQAAEWREPHRARPKPLASAPPPKPPEEPLVPKKAKRALRLRDPEEN